MGETNLKPVESDGKQTPLTEDLINQINRAWIASQPGKDPDGREYGEKYNEGKVRCEPTEFEGEEYVTVFVREFDFFSRHSDAYHDLVDAAMEKEWPWETFCDRTSVATYESYGDMYNEEITPIVGKDMKPETFPRLWAQFLLEQGIVKITEDGNVEVV